MGKAGKDGSWRVGRRNRALLCVVRRNPSSSRNPVTKAVRRCGKRTTYYTHACAAPSLFSGTQMASLRYERTHTPSSLIPRATIIPAVAPTALRLWRGTPWRGSHSGRFPRNGHRGPLAPGLPRHGALARIRATDFVVGRPIAPMG